MKETNLAPFKPDSHRYAVAPSRAFEYNWEEQECNENFIIYSGKKLVINIIHVLHSQKDYRNY